MQQQEIPACRSTYLRFVGVLGKGAFGMALLAENQIGHKLVVKAVKKVPNLHPSHQKRLEYEWLCLHSNTDCEYLSRGICAFQTYNFVCMLMDYAESCTLLDYLKHLPTHCLAEDFAATIFAQVAEGLNYLHTLGVIHRDLKDDNVLLTSYCNAKIIDFGLAVCLSDKEHLSMFAGTTEFMPPEALITDRLSLTPAFDYWSYGVMLYLTLSGSFPYEFNEDWTILQTRMCSIVYPANFSSEVVKLLRSLLELSPLKRLNVHVDMNWSGWFGDWDVTVSKRPHILDLPVNQFEELSPADDIFCSSLDAVDVHYLTLAQFPLLTHNMASIYSADHRRKSMTSQMSKRSDHSHFLDDQTREFEQREQCSYSSHLREERERKTPLEPLTEASILHHERATGRRHSFGRLLTESEEDWQRARGSSHTSLATISSDRGPFSISDELGARMPEVWRPVVTSEVEGSQFDRSERSLDDDDLGAKVPENKQWRSLTSPESSSFRSYGRDRSFVDELGSEVSPAACHESRPGELSFEEDTVVEYSAFEADQSRLSIASVRSDLSRMTLSNVHIYQPSTCPPKIPTISRSTRNAKKQSSFVGLKLCVKRIGGLNERAKIICLWSASSRTTTYLATSLSRRNKDQALMLKVFPPEVKLCRIKELYYLLAILRDKHLFAKVERAYAVDSLAVLSFYPFDSYMTLEEHILSSEHATRATINLIEEAKDANDKKALQLVHEKRWKKQVFQIMNALCVMQERGMAHNNLDTSNVLYDAMSEDIQLVGFSKATPCEPGTANLRDQNAVLKMIVRMYSRSGDSARGVIPNYFSLDLLILLDILQLGQPLKWYGMKKLEFFKGCEPTTAEHYPIFAQATPEEVKKLPVHEAYLK